MTIDVLILSHNFQRRLCWVLSSMIQQAPHELQVSVNISGLLNEPNGTPTNTEVVDFFRGNGVNASATYYPKEIFAYPSIVKNYQIKDSKADWILCHSADHVMHPQFFASLHEHLRVRPAETKVIGSKHKIHTDAAATDRLISKMGSTPEFVEHAYTGAETIKRLDPSIQVGNRMGGHFAFRREACIERTGGKYTDPETCRDRHLFNKGMKSRSDIGFRQAMGGGIHVDLPPMIHLNTAYRDKELGYHSTEQR